MSAMNGRQIKGTHSLALYSAMRHRALNQVMRKIEGHMEMMMTIT